MRLVDALEEVTYPAGHKVIVQGEGGDLFYIIKGGEAIVYVETPEGQRKVNHLFKADFFGERALLSAEPRCVHAAPATLFWCHVEALFVL